MNDDLVRRLEAAGFHYKSPESPEIWTHLESQFVEPSAFGPRFGLFSLSRMTEMIARCEEILLDALASQLKDTGTLNRVTKTVEMPYTVGTSGYVSSSDVDNGSVFELVINAGTPAERLARFIICEDQAIPTTHYVTVSGGLYADRYTFGYFNMTTGQTGYAEDPIYLTTHARLMSLARDMDAKSQDITVLSPAACSGLFRRVQQLAH